MNNVRIMRDHLILCEGKDEQSFLLNLLDYYKKNPDYKLLDRIQIMNFGGVNDLRRSLSNIVETSDFSRVKSLTIIQDAETNGQGMLESIKSSLSRNGFPYPETVFQRSGDAANPANPDQPIRTGIILFPCTTTKVKNREVPSNGTLEDLCLSILKPLKGDPSGLREMSDAFVKTVNQRRDTAFKKIHKNRIHVYLAATDQCVDLKVGEAAKTEVFDRKAPVIQKIIRFLLKMEEDTDN